MKTSSTTRRYIGNRSLWCMFALWCAFVGLPAHAQTVDYIHTDALGSPIAVTNASQQVIERSEYAPYGDLLNRPDTDGPGYTGHVLDAVTGMSYMQQRYYDSGLGRFLSADPITAYSNPTESFSRYRYANDNPYRFSDPDGRESAELSLRGVQAIQSNIKNLTPDQISIALTLQAAILLGPIAPETAGAARAVVMRKAVDQVARSGKGEQKGSEVKTVGRWMSREELEKMKASGRVQEGGGGQTRVSDPPNPDTYRNPPSGDVYVEFDVPASRVLPHSTGTGRIPGPKSPDARVPGRNPDDFQMPSADNIRVP